MVTELHAAGAEVIGIGSQESSEHAGLMDYVSQDLARGWPDGLHVDAIVHLAGLSAVGPSFDDPQRYIEHNSAMVTHMCESLLAGNPQARVLVVSSGAVYDARQKQPLDEGSALGFNSPYVVSKVLVENQTAYYATRGLDMVVARPFNHIGPGQGLGFLVPDLVAAMRSAVESGEPMTVGDLSTRRDYTDVRDVVRAYRFLLSVRDLPRRVFNVCSMTTRSGHEILEALLDHMPDERPSLRVDPERVRPNDPPDILGDCSALRRLTGWAPEIDLATTINDVLECDEASEGE